MSSSIEENKALVRRFFAAIERGDFRLFDEIVAQDYDDHLAGQSRGRDTLKRYSLPDPGRATRGTLGDR